MKLLAALLLSIGTFLALDPLAPEQVVPVAQPVESREPPKALSATDDALFQRLKRHIEDVADQRQEKRMAKLADEIREYKEGDEAKVGADGKVGVVLAGTAIAAAIGFIIKKIIAAIIFSIIASLILSWLWNHWFWLVGGLVLYFLLTWAIARQAAYSVVGRA